MSRGRDRLIDLEQPDSVESGRWSDREAAAAHRPLSRRSAFVTCFVIGALALIVGVVLFAPSASQGLPRVGISNSRALRSPPLMFPDFAITDVTIDGTTFTYHPVGYVGETLVSMILEPAPGKEWFQGEGKQKGKKKNLGHINFDGGKLSSFRVSFVENGTRDAVSIPRLAFTIHEIDSSKKGPENVTVHGTAGYYTTQGSRKYFRISESIEGTVSVESTRFGDGGDNPKDVDALSDEHMDKSITLYFEGVTEFLMDVDLTGISGRGARNLMFSLVQVVNQELPPDCGVKVHEFRFTEASVSEDKVITYPKVGKVDEEDVDFVIQAAEEGSWHTTWPKWSGVHAEGLGKLMALVGRTSRFQASFYKSGTTTPIIVPNFAFTIYDIDSGWDGPERYLVHGLASFSMREPEFFVEEHGDSLVAASLVQDLGGHNNPDSTNFTDEQVKLSVTANFENTSTFLFDFDMSGMGARDNHRMMYFTLLHTVDTCATVMRGS